MYVYVICVALDLAIGQTKSVTWIWWHAIARAHNKAKIQQSEIKIHVRWVDDVLHENELKRNESKWGKH